MSEQEYQPLVVSSDSSYQGAISEKVGMRPSAESRIGETLREARKKVGLSYNQISKITRLRPHILEALENENWTQLPSPVFVAGFIRSYARAVGLDDSDLVEVYRKSGAADDPLPRPLVKPTKKRKRPYVLPLLFGFALVTALYLWKTHIPHEAVTRPQETRAPDATSAVNTDQSQVQAKGDITPALNEDVERSAQARPDAADMVYENEPLPEGEDVIAAYLNAASPVDATGIETPDELPSEESLGPASIEMESSEVPKSPLALKEPDLVLKAAVREVTWIKVLVDEKEVKEYILQPGERLVWRAKTGFELTIGNAGGIDLELNGERIEHIGARGQVVRLKLPDKKEGRQTPE